ncbi:MAG: malonyl-ACP O-methyltransferase BioC [Deltaproteobacteria bacterium]|nr:malonyl-ACP O-methyltransferase BioC [Deltaproteobacteria bacterium]MBW2134852.1 malonyl-ACP O-methyltransferase BioC [Deltaproteobacteria bacterium]
MTVDKRRLGRNFGRQASRYDQYSQVQRYMADQLLGYLQNMPRLWSRILEIGCGTGYLTRLLRQAFPKAHLTALDLATAAVQECKRHLGNDDRVTLLVADGEQPLGGKFDLIISNSVFQWFNQPAQSCQSYREHLHPGGWLIFATLGPETFQELAVSLDRAARQLSVAAGGTPCTQSIPAAGFAARDEWQQFLLQAGFKRVAVHRQRLVVSFPGVMEFLKAIQGMGATRPQPGPLSRKLLNLMMSGYEAAYRVNGTIPVTYELLWGLACNE